MDQLPDEVILNLLQFLEAREVVAVQRLSSRYLALGRDNVVWKLECFNHSRAEAQLRREQLLAAQDSRLTELRNAVSALPTPRSNDEDLDSPIITDERQSDPAATERQQWQRALANWEPGYPGERIDYYEEFVQRHADINVDWIRLPKPQTNDKETLREATGVALLNDGFDSGPQHIVAPLDDGSVCIFDITPRSTLEPGGGGRLLSRSKPGLLTGRDDPNESHAIMTETGAVECVSVNPSTQKGSFAVQNTLHEVDLNTLRLISSKPYPFRVTALSSTSGFEPLAVGTNHTIHLHDSRDPYRPSATAELIAGPTSQHATLSQPGPLALLHYPQSNTLWTAGRFTSLLNYDVRRFPRLLGTLHSGARVASLSLLPYSLLSPRSATGSTLVAAAAYKGKGSLELLDLPSRPTLAGPNSEKVKIYQNRQTASASKLLSAVPHGGRLVFSDGDGNLKWVERDGRTEVRRCDINDFIPQSPSHDPSPRAPRADIFGRQADDLNAANGTVVQKILPVHGPSTSSFLSSGVDRPDVPTQSLLLWTGDGELGVLNFSGSKGGKDAFYDALEDQEQVGGEELARRDAERQFSARMRRALERSAEEVRFVRGLGMGG
nr:hypothetical protein B0A51_18522 [Rachicladosporium sp. CCFEE 5018]